MDRWLLLLSVLLAAVAAVQGARYVHKGVRSKWTVVWMLLCLLTQFSVLGARGEMRGACPLGDMGEMLVFVGWSLTLFYLAIGSVYRLSLLGVFTAPLVCFLLSVALIPGLMSENVVRAAEIDAWREAHAAFSVLAYGGLGLAAVAACMFLVLDKQLKGASLSTGLFKNLPPVRELIAVVQRLLVLGFATLSLGIICGLVMESAAGAGKHLIAASVQWGLYAVLLGVAYWRGLPARKLSIAAIGLFFLSLLIFPLL